MQDTCWIYDGRIDADGYGRWGKHLTHRLSYEVLVGPIPPGLHLDHVRARGCTQKACYNPRHLEPVTLEENNRRSWATRAPVTTCKNGHAVTPRRRCTECARKTAREWFRSNRMKTQPRISA